MPSQIRTRLAEVLDLVDIGAAIDRRIGTYSGGMKRRLDLAAALVHNPEVLFLDEPTTGLDPHSRTAVWSEVRRLNRELGMTIFLTTQYLEEADTLADRVGIISSGRLMAEGAPAVLKHSVGHDVIVAEVDGDGTRAARDPPFLRRSSSPPGAPMARSRSPPLTDRQPWVRSQWLLAGPGCTSAASRCGHRPWTMSSWR